VYPLRERIVVSYEISTIPKPLRGISYNGTIFQQIYRFKRLNWKLNSVDVNLIKAVLMLRIKNRISALLPVGHQIL
jgi:hypothetical protein